MAKIFITGTTGFLGSNIASFLLKSGHQVGATYRSSSSKVLCKGFENKITWFLQTTDNWQSEVIAFKPDIIVHSAWIGVGHANRTTWESQLANIDYVKTLLLIAKESNIQKFIGLGSQAEYGDFSGCVDEDYLASPKEAYGCVKVICNELVKQFCTNNAIDWFWLRVFSVFGKGESNKWLIPSLVHKLLTADHMDFTPGEQQYAYLYVEDLALAIDKVIAVKGKSGIYNISGKNLISVKSLITSIRDQINPLFKLNFGKLDYRENQSMQIQGDVTKFVKEFGEFEISNFTQSLALTIDYIKQQTINPSV